MNQLKVIGWSVWYENDFYTSKDSKWEDIPDDGVQVVYFYKSDGRRLHCSGDSSYFYAPHPKGEIWASNRDEPDAVKKRYPGAIVKRGKWIPLPLLEEIDKRATEYVW